MFEAFLLFVLLVGLAGKRGEGWEWSRERAARVLRGWVDQVGIVARRVRAALPGMWSCCRQDVRSLVEDIVAVAHPRLYHRIATQRSVGLPAPAGVAPPAGSLATSRSDRGPGAREKLASALRGVAGSASAEAMGTHAWRRLQRRYLEGRITLEQYVAEAERLRSGAT
jgi:hypothetical protein